MSETMFAGARTAAAMPRLLLARALRDFADGFMAVLLPVYLTMLGHSPVEVGLVASVALAGSALTTLAAGFLGARFEHRRLLVAASVLMVATGLALMASTSYAVILVVAFAGTLNPQGGSISVFVPFEHAVLTRDVRDAERTRAFARYGLVGALAAAVGAFAAATPDVLGWFDIGRMAALRAMFVLYALLGLGGAVLYASLPTPQAAATGPIASVVGPSRSIVIKLAALFSIDSFAGGFVVQSLLALWLLERFGLSLTAVGVLLLLGGRPRRLFISGRSLDCGAHRPRPHDGLDAHSLEPAADRGGLRTDDGDCGRLPACARRAVADGRADAFLLRDGRRDAAGARGRRELHIGAAQPRGGSEPGSGRLARVGRLSLAAAGHLRRSQDHL